MIHGLVSDLLAHPKVVETQQHMHHSISKHDHLARTARISYKLAQLMRADVRICVRAAMIHDIDSRLGTLRTHGGIAAAWAARQGESDAVCHAIEAHMYPFGPKPRTREAWVVSLADKAASITDLTIMVSGMMTGHTWLRRKRFRVSDPHYAALHVRKLERHLHRRRRKHAHELAR